MCGIAGIMEMGRSVDRDVLARMTNALRHRGPDDEQYYFSADRAGGPSIGFGFRRLAIIDLSGGRQPMCNEDGSIWIVCNGEIYNHTDLRKDLEAKGHRFKTKCDVESLLHLYEEHGPDCVKKANGMFALAIWDSRNDTLFLARDRLGKKPLYYRDSPTQFLFGSELKGLLQHPQCPRELDFKSLSKYLSYEYVPSPHCIIKGIHRLPAGHSLIRKNGQARIQKYWDLSFGPGSRRACFDSSNDGSSNPMQKVFTCRAGINSVIIATTALESMPPLRNTPRGTSLMSLRRTASRNRSTSSWAISLRCARREPGPKLRSQYF